MAERRTDKPKQAKRAAPAAKRKTVEAPAAIIPALPVIAPPEPDPEPAPAGPAVPRLYMLHPLLVGPLPAFDAAFERAASLGFSGVLLPPPFAPGGSGHLYQIADPDSPHPALEAEGDSSAALAVLAEKAKAHGLELYLDLVLDRVAADGRLAREQADWFAPIVPSGTPDPRLDPPDWDTLRARWDDPDVVAGLGAWWEERLRRFAAAGVSGFRCDAPARTPGRVWRRLTSALPEARFLAWTVGLPADALPDLTGVGFTATFDSLAWWDLREDWLTEEAARLAAIAPAIATVEAPFGPRLAARDPDPAMAERAALRHLRLAAGIGAGLLVPMGFEYGARRPLDPARDRPGDWDWIVQHAPFDLSNAIRAANAMLADRPLAQADLRPLAGPGAPATALLRAAGPDVRTARRAALVLANPDLHRPASVTATALLPGTGGVFTRFTPCVPAEGPGLEPGGALLLQPGEVRILEAIPPRPIRPAAEVAAEAGARMPRLGIEAIEPVVDGGRFPVKRTVGEVIEVRCDVVCDGHDKLAAALLWRAADEDTWCETRLRPLGNDRWAASFPLERMGRYSFAVEAWRDAFATFTDELQKKHNAGVPVSLELEEGRLLVEAAGQRAGGAVAELAAKLKGAGEGERLALLLAPETAALMADADDRPFRLRSAEIPVEAERTGARFASWYELFPRSQSGDPVRHGTFDDVIRQLPRIRRMGFDVLYFPPIHPIGKKNRKGRNNTLTPGPQDPGSPYAIGSEDGGHDALHPELGTLEDFRRLVREASAHGLELALDFAIQCSPDHPWLREHKEWFDWRPDGSLRYAENPPKKYEDIVNVDFYNEGAVPSLWIALRDVVRFWCDQGVRLFRVDNPHTKPFPFWEWLIADIRARHPDAVFLAEAFTRPKVMYRLAKLGFGQSYTYFTWRNEKQEIEEYLTELTTTAPKDFFRPHFFVNTPDINPLFLQSSGRPGFLIRAALATTLSGLWGMVQGYEFCEARAMPGKEEYLDSEKYQLRTWPERAPGDIVEEITRLNAIRRANPALQTQMGLAFHNAFNDNVLWYRKATAERDNCILVAVSLDPHHVQQASVELPLWEWGLPDHAALEAEDLMRGHRFTWQGKMQQIRLDPGELPFGIWRVRPAGGI
ncbi:maltotransferase domain-containing protein [Belnapia rosea]|uniref:maltotransferase domain-containing protein n=1 Tax=Belnapia rosea TaxID=938405 RepID=UPI0008874CBB|nr:maltotransferase domain-containing protein [Belnapia rosea]SDB15994.1 alpha-1,4-glucan:maltose-1-phosphate maltosyltransferase [Belnapia rosea]